jgi:hypothetical protein
MLSTFLRRKSRNAWWAAVLLQLLEILQVSQAGLQVSLLQAQNC